MPTERHDSGRLSLPRLVAFAAPAGSVGAIFIPLLGHVTVQIERPSRLGKLAESTLLDKRIPFG